MAKISVHLVTWNNRKVLPGALESLRAQTFRDFSLVVVDNASTDGSLDCVRQHFPEATVLRNFKNLGFARGQNLALEMARKGRPQYVLLMNPDIILTPDCLERLLASIEGYPEIGAACGKLLRVLPPYEEHEDPRFTEIIDSTGLAIKRNRRAVDRGSGEADRGQYGKPAEVFGAPGALALYSLEALDEAAAVGEVFDEDFFAYQEDVDLAWRLRLFGWKAAYAPKAEAYHYRGAGGAERAGPFEALVGRMKRPATVNRFSTRNHLWLLVKNEDLSNALLHAPFIVPYEIAKFFATLILAPAVLTAYLEYWMLLPKMLKKRRGIMGHRKASPSEMRKWFT